MKGKEMRKNSIVSVEKNELWIRDLFVMFDLKLEVCCLQVIK